MCHGVKSLPDLRAGGGGGSVGPPRVLQVEGRSGSRKARRLPHRMPVCVFSGSQNKVPQTE